MKFQLEGHQEIDTQDFRSVVDYNDCLKMLDRCIDKACQTGLIPADIIKVRGKVEFERNQFSATNPKEQRFYKTFWQVAKDRLPEDQFNILMSEAKYLLNNPY